MPRTRTLLFAAFLIAVPASATSGFVSVLLQLDAGETWETRAGTVSNLSCFLLTIAGTANPNGTASVGAMTAIFTAPGFAASITALYYDTSGGRTTIRVLGTQFQDGDPAGPQSVVANTGGWCGLSKTTTYDVRIVSMFPGAAPGFRTWITGFNADSTSPVFTLAPPKSGGDAFGYTATQFVGGAGVDDEPMGSAWLGATYDPPSTQQPEQGVPGPTVRHVLPVKTLSHDLAFSFASFDQFSSLTIKRPGQGSFDSDMVTTCPYGLDSSECTVMGAWYASGLLDAVAPISFRINQSGSVFQGSSTFVVGAPVQW